MVYTRKWWWLGALALVAAGINYSLSVEGRVDKQSTRQTARVDFSSLSETVIATGVGQFGQGTNQAINVNWRQTRRICHHLSIGAVNL